MSGEFVTDKYEEIVLVACEDCGRSFYCKNSEVEISRCYYCPYYRPEGKLERMANVVTKKDIYKHPPQKRIKGL